MTDAATVDLARLVERGEAAANLDMFRAAPAGVAELLGLEAFSIGDGLALMAREIDDTQFNRVFGLGVEAPIRPEHLDQVARSFRPLGHSKARLQLAPIAERRLGVAEALAARGMARAPGGWTKRARPTAEPLTAPSDLAIVEAQDVPGRFGETACGGFGVPGFIAPWFEALVGRPNWRTYLAMDGDAAVGTAALYLAEDCGWLGVGSVLPQARGRGGQGALMARRIETARAAGKAWAITETGAPLPGEAPGPSYRNMDRHGFAEIHLRANYVI